MRFLDGALSGVVGAASLFWVCPGSGAAFASEEAPSAKSTKPNPAAEWRPLMDRVQLGEVDVALTGFREMAAACGPSGAPVCSDEEQSIIYGCIGIILATEGEHNRGVQAFRKALVLNPNMQVIPEFQSTPVMAAYREAQGRPPSAASASASASSEDPQSAPSDESDETEVSPRQDEGGKGRLMVLVTGQALYGSLSLYEGYRIGEAFKGTGGVVIAGMPGTTSGFTMGLRARGGAYSSAASGALGAMSLQFALGGTIGPRKNNRFSYFLGQFGPEYFPALSGGSFLASFQGGTSIGGLALGGGIDVSAGTHGFYAGIGLELGYGMLL